jgi:hypothetical protein
MKTKLIALTLVAFALFGGVASASTKVPPHPSKATIKLCVSDTRKTLHAAVDANFSTVPTRWTDANAFALIAATQEQQILTAIIHIKGSDAAHKWVNSLAIQHACVDAYAAYNVMYG